MIDDPIDRSLSLLKENENLRLQVDKYRERVGALRGTLVLIRERCNQFVEDRKDYLIDEHIDMDSRPVVAGVNLVVDIKNLVFGALTLTGDDLTHE